MKDRHGSNNPNWRGGPKPCSVAGCVRPAVCKGWCIGHYQRVKKTGQLSPKIPLSKSIGHKGTNNGRWKGGQMRSRGRTYVYRPDHPHATKQGYVARYRLVMEEQLGRLLTPEEVVHHEGNDPGHDDPSKLKVLSSQSEHARLHFAKTTVEMVRRVRELHRTIGPTKIAELTGLPVRRVKAIIGRETWKDI